MKRIIAGASAAIRELSLPGRGALAVLATLIIIAVCAPLLAGHPPDVSSGPPLSPPGGSHLMGTDQLGLDIWAMICHGARISLAVGLLTALLASLGGAATGIVAAQLGGRLDRLIMRAMDVMIVLPDLPVMIILAAFFGPSLRNIILILALFSWPGPARLVRSQALALKQQPYIKMAAHYGGGTVYLLWRHYLPELFPIILVSMIRLAGMAVITEASLSFLGLGDPTARSWGLLINHAVYFPGIYFTPFWKWWLLYPWLFLTLMVSSLALLGRDLEKLADPRLKL